MAGRRRANEADGDASASDLRGARRDPWSRARAGLRRARDALQSFRAAGRAQGLVQIDQRAEVNANDFDAALSAVGPLRILPVVSPDVTLLDAFARALRPPPSASCSRLAQHEVPREESGCAVGEGQTLQSAVSPPALPRSRRHASRHVGGATPLCEIGHHVGNLHAVLYTGRHVGSRRDGLRVCLHVYGLHGDPRICRHVDLHDDLRVCLLVFDRYGDLHTFDDLPDALHACLHVDGLHACHRACGLYVDHRTYRHVGHFRDDLCAYLHVDGPRAYPHVGGLYGDLLVDGLRDAQYVCPHADCSYADHHAFLRADDPCSGLYGDQHADLYVADQYADLHVDDLEIVFPPLFLSVLDLHVVPEI